MTESLRRVLFATLLFAGIATAAEPAGTARTALDTYLAGLNTWSADFTQTAVDAKDKRVAGSEYLGRLVIVRPGKFRLELRPQGAREVETLIVVDGRNHWNHDVELAQVTVRPAEESLSQSPAMLLAGGADLRRAFEVASSGRRDNLDWVRATPRDAASDFREAQFGFSGNTLNRIVVLDKLGQRSTLVFRNVRRNATVDPKLVAFTPPAGVDVIGKPLPAP